MINENQGISRINAARELEIDRSTVTNIVPELLRVGIIEEIDQHRATGRGGRPPSPLYINRNFGFTIGIAIYLQGFNAVVLDLHGEAVSRHQGPLPEGVNDFSGNCHAIIKQLEAAIAKETGVILGVVIALSGTVNPEKNYIERSYIFDLVDFDFQQEISDKYAFPVLVENDANACAWGELYPPWNKKYSSFLYLLARPTAYDKKNHLDSGMAIGIGLVADGRMIYGSHNNAGEMRSCFWRLRNGKENQVSIPLDRLSAISDDDSIFMEFILEILDSLGPVISVLDPEAIIFGGDIKDKLHKVQEILESPETDNFLGTEYSRYAITAPQKGDMEICAGAACFFLYRLFKQNFQYPEKKNMIKWERMFQLKRSVH